MEDRPHRDRSLLAHADAAAPRASTAAIAVTGAIALAALAALAACRPPPGAWTGGGDGPAAARAALAWDAPVELAAGGGRRGPWRQNASDFDHVDDPSVVLDPDGTAYVAWVDHRSKDVWFAVHGAAGARRGPAVNVSRTPAVFSWLPRLARAAAHPGDVYVLWQEIVFSGGSHGGEMFFARSLDGGATFEPPQNLSRSVPGDGKGRIDRRVWQNGSFDLAVAPDGALYAVWTEFDGPLWLARSRDRGASFSPPRRLAGTADAPARAPSIAVGPDGAVHVAWSRGEDPTADIELATSRDGGETFGAPAALERTPGFSDAPELAVDAAGTLHLAFAESDGGPAGRFHVRYARRPAGGAFERARPLAPPGALGARSAAYPALAADDRGRVLVAWELYVDDGPRPRGLALAWSRDGGARFTGPVLVPGSRDPAGGTNGSHQGLLLDKLAATGAGFALANSSLRLGAGSRVWLMRGRLRDR